MRYVHHRPVAESHEVRWDHGQRHGIYDETPRTTFGSLKLSAEVVAWLDENAAGWSFRSDWDYSNAGDDDEGCHLTVPSAEAAKAFIAFAGGISDEWVRRDREHMPVRILLETPEGRTEVMRAHRAHDTSMNLMNALNRLLPFDDHRYGIFAERDAMQAVRDIAGEGPAERRIALRLRADEAVEPGTAAYTVIVAIVDIPEGEAA